MTETFVEIIKVTSKGICYEVTKDSCNKVRIAVYDLIYEKKRDLILSDVDLSGLEVTQQITIIEELTELVLRKEIEFRIHNKFLIYGENYGKEENSRSLYGTVWVNKINVNKSILHAIEKLRKL